MFFIKSTTSLTICPNKYFTCFLTASLNCGPSDGGAGAGNAQQHPDPPSMSSTQYTQKGITLIRTRQYVHKHTSLAT